MQICEQCGGVVEVEFCETCGAWGKDTEYSTKARVIPFLCGDGSGEIPLVVKMAWNDGLGARLVGLDDKCPFCKGDPIAEESGPETLIGAYFARNKWVETCPVCMGRPT